MGKLPLDDERFPCRYFFVSRETKGCENRAIINKTADFHSLVVYDYRILFILRGLRYRRKSS